jgi:solute carrier family 25 carnitine/acylcarnitine transporter 20/29|tara:strand:+ start:854 stop:1252 length:399 start_codon:yes stop_codon:yes gene_type:complete
MGMMRGFWPSAGRESFFAAGYLGVSPWLQSRLSDVGVGDQAGAVAGALLSGVVSAALTHPLDTIKSCMQGDIEGERYGTMTQTARALYAEEGSLRVFFRGYGTRATMICGCFWIFNEAKLQLGPYIYPHRFE